MDAPNCTLYSYEGNGYFLYDCGAGRKALEEIRVYSSILAFPAALAGNKVR